MTSRRGFLGMIGGALTAPFVPSVSLVARAGYPASAFHAAIYHAQTRVTVSAFGLAHVLGLKSAQAEALMADLSARGVIGPVQGAARGGWASSNVLIRHKGSAVAAQRLAKGARPRAVAPPRQTPDARTWSEPDLRPFLANLCKMAENHGLTLHPRCAQQYA